ncbi:Transmembrane domain-containing protein [Brazilian cedratvirus IHUMI]|uniref:Transmembrane domain-containing protein n=1 Tax=Brazilian cedratvirus IHUMI TaxID=2126980 RepID=A0A2R8FFD8_9VIRU|nr:Transmembrane domain-containing protein [Brazilian cedratvirus IHUMI]
MDDVSININPSFPEKDAFSIIEASPSYTRVVYFVISVFVVIVKTNLVLTVFEKKIDILSGEKGASSHSFLD